MDHQELDMVINVKVSYQSSWEPTSHTSANMFPICAGAFPICMRATYPSVCGCHVPTVGSVLMDMHPDPHQLVWELDTS